MALKKLGSISYAPLARKMKKSSKKREKKTICAIYASKISMLSELA
jgi:hypothetical protein